MAVGTSGAPRASAGTSSCLCFHAVYTDLAWSVHDSAYDTISKTWSDQIVAGSVPAASDPFHNNQFDPKANSWFDQIPLGSVPLSNSVFDGPSAVDEGGGYFRIVYVGNDVHLHQARFDANAKPKTWSDTIVPFSVLTDEGYTRVGFANDPTPSFHVVYRGVDGFVHNDREDLGTSTWYDQVPPGSIQAAANSVPTFTLGNDGHDHVLYFGTDGFVHNDNYDPVTRSWFDQIPPGSTFTEASPNASTTYDDTFPVVYSDGTHIHVDIVTPSKGTWSDIVPPGSAKGIFGRAPAVANTTSDLKFRPAVPGGALVLGPLLLVSVH